jgi:CelD/BcsL family acetyltransferase involved in cellulose biosynthesis
MPTKKDQTSRTREGGTSVTVPASSAERIAAFRRIVEEKQYAMIDGCTVDLFSASVVVQVYDALSETNREKFAAMPAWKMTTVAFKLIK